MSPRLDLPPIARQLDTELGNELHLDALDADTAAAITAVSSQLLNAIAALENDVIISKRLNADNTSPLSHHKDLR